jgi:hypothetical protein
MGDRVSVTVGRRRVAVQVDDRVLPAIELGLGR